MDENIHLLNDICKNTEMGIDGIKLVKKRCKNRSMRKALNRQLSEYGDMYDRASGILDRLGETPKKINAAAKISTHIAMTTKGFRDPSASHIAEMMIQGNTMGVIQLTRQKKRCRGCNSEVMRLAEELIVTEENNLDEMKFFL